MIQAADVESMAPEKDDDVVVNIRLPREWLGRVDVLVSGLEGEEHRQGLGRVSRSSVLRQAVFLGLERLEARHGQGDDEGTENPDLTLLLAETMARVGKELMSKAAQKTGTARRKKVTKRR